MFRLVRIERARKIGDLRRELELYAEFGLSSDKDVPYSWGGSQDLPRRWIVQRILEETKDVGSEARLAQALASAVDELAELERSLNSARLTGVSADILQQLKERTAVAANSLWRTAGRTAAVADQGIRSPSIDKRADREAVKVRQLGKTARNARINVAQLTFGNDGYASEGVQRAEASLRAYSEAVEELERL